jgi:hypothetical protein
MLDYTFARTFAFAELRKGKRVNACKQFPLLSSASRLETSPMYSLPDPFVRPYIAISSSACSLPDSEKVRMRS